MKVWGLFFCINTYDYGYQDTSADMLYKLYPSKEFAERCYARDYAYLERYYDLNDAYLREVDVCTKIKARKPKFSEKRRTFYEEI